MDNSTRKQPVRETTSSYASLLKAGLEGMGLVADPAMIRRLEWYVGELLRWNSKMNLIAAAPLKDVVEAHFLDSLSLLPLLSHEGTTLLDVGSGAGFPGLALKAARPDLRVTLVEPREKRAGFLRHVIRGLSLRDIDVFTCRLPVENNPLHPLAGRHYDVVTSRALSDTAHFLTMVEELTAVGSRVICMKGPKAEEELSAWQSTKQGSPLHFKEKASYALPFSNTTRYLLIFSR